VVNLLHIPNRILRYTLTIYLYKYIQCSILSIENNNWSAFNNNIFLVMFIKKISIVAPRSLNSKELKKIVLLLDERKVCLLSIYEILIYFSV
jgi:hypothetical protein